MATTIIPVICSPDQPFSPDGLRLKKYKPGAELAKSNLPLSSVSKLFNFRPEPASRVRAKKPGLGLPGSIVWAPDDPLERPDKSGRKTRPL